MLKQYIMGGKRDKNLLSMYHKAMQGVRSILLGQTGRLDAGGLLFVGELNIHSRSKLSGKMDHLVCFLPGVLALGHFYGIETGAGHFCLQRCSAFSIGNIVDLSRHAVSPNA